MIVTVTPAPALDITYTVPALVPNSSHRVGTVAARAGGKGINVARVLTTQGFDVLATAMLGGGNGDAVEGDLVASGIPHKPYRVAGETRRTVAVVADGDATVFNEPGPTISSAEWAGFVDHCAALFAQARVAVFSGSLPPGVGSDGYADLLRVAGDCRTILDTTGARLLAGAAVGVDIVKPNAAELLEATGETDPLVAASALRGARTVVVSQGPDGLLVLGPEGRWRVRPGTHVHGNPTGAGDACVAALAAGLAAGWEWERVLREAVAWSAAAVAAPLAGDVDGGTLAAVRESVVVEPA